MKVQMTSKMSEAYKKNMQIKALQSRINLLSSPTLDQRPSDKAKVEKMKKQITSLKN